METKTINSKCVVAILILWSMGFTSAGQELNLTIEPATLNLNSSNTFTIINTGTNPLPYTIEANTSFRTSHFNQLTTWNEEPISAGPADTAAIPNNAKWTTEIAFSDDFNESILTYSLYSPMGPGSMGTGNINGEVGWASERDNWDCVRPYPHIIASYLRGRADGSGIPSGVFSPKAVTGTENISSISMDVNFDYSSGSTWQFIPQSTNTNLVVTRLQINPDHTLQVLVKDEFENASFQRILTELPLGGFALSMEVDRKTSVFTIFFNGLKVFTGRGFSNSISQMAMITLNEKAGSALFFNGFLTHSLLPGNDFVINSCSSLILVYEDFDYNGKSKINGTLQSGESLTRQLDFSVSDLSPGIYRDSIKISTNESDQPVAFLPYSITLENPYEMPGDYHFTSVAPMTLTYDTLEATVYKGDSAIIHLNLNNSSTVEQSVYFPDAIQNPSGYRAFSRGSQNFQWKDISSTGTALTLGNDDSQVVEIPFSGSITIGSNGYMIFGTTRADDPDNMPMYDTYRYLYNTLAPYWDDLAPDDSSSIKYQTIADEFIVQYTNVLINGTLIRNTFQVILNKNGVIKFQYLRMNDRQSANIGFALDEYYEAIDLAGNEPFVSDSLAILFHPEATQIIYDSNAEYQTYSMYPWIEYPSAFGEVVAPNSNQQLDIKLSTTVLMGYPGESLPVGITKGYIFLLGHHYAGDDYQGWDTYDAGAFVLPVKLTVLDNPPPVTDPVQAVSLFEGESKIIVISATDPNDTQITISLDSLPDFITLLQSQDGSVEYKINPEIGDAGEFTLLISAKDPHGAVDVDTLHLSVSLINAVVNFSLIDFKTGAIVSTFDQQLTLDVADPDLENYTIQANIASEAGSVKFSLDGHKINIDNSLPFAINAWALPVLSPGSHTLVVQSFSKNNAKGALNDTKEAYIIVMNSSTITSFQIADRNGNKIRELVDGDSIYEDQAQFNDYNIVANVSIPTIRSVKFILNGITARIDNRAPYAISGKANGKDTFWNADPGVYTLTAIPYMKYYAWGPEGSSRTVHFTIINSTQNSPGLATTARLQSDIGNAAVNEAQMSLYLYPNPVIDELNISLSNITEGQFILKIINLNAQVMYIREGNAQTIQTISISTTQLGLNSGVYYIQLIGSNGFSDVRKFIKQ